MKEELKEAITVIAAIVTILGVSFFGGKSIFSMIISKSEPEKETVTDASATDAPVITIVVPTSNPDYSTVAPGANEEEASSKSSFAIEPTVIPKDISSKKNAGNTTALKFKPANQEADSHTKRKTEGSQKDDAENNDSEDSQKDTAENSDSENTSVVSSTEEPAIANNEEDNTSDQTINKELDVPSSGYLLLTAENPRRQAKKEESTIDIAQIADENGNRLESPEFSSFEYSEIVNEDNLEQENDRIYIPVSIGIYSFTFTNCEIDNLEISLTEYTFDDDNNVAQENGGHEDENLMVPSQNIWQFNVTQNQPEMSCDFKSEKSFTPLIQFYSEEVNEEEIYITVLDGENNNLQTIKLNQTNENGSYEIIGEFSFIENEEYHLKISSDIGLNAVSCFLSFIEIENEE